MKKLFAAALVFAAIPALGQGGLFPQPLHLTREVSGSASSSVIEEYFIGDRAVSIRGERTTITDHAKGELTEIDRAAGTFSVTTFARIASAAPNASRMAVIPRYEIEETAPSSTTRLPGRRFLSVVSSAPSEGLKVDVTISESTRLSKDALAVLVGSAWPGRPGPESEIVVEAAKRAMPDSQSRLQRAYGLPVEQVVTYTVLGEEERLVNRVLRVGSELPPPELIAIPPGAREVPSPIVERARILEELDRLPSEVTRP